jgi:hypothetical protein
MFRPRSITSLLLAFVVATTTFVRAAEPLTEKAISAVLENDSLRVEVSSIGGKILALRDKVRGREEAKVLSYIAGINEVRYQAVLGVNDTSSRFALASTKDASGNPTIVAVAHATPTDELPAAATVTKRYTLEGHSGRIRIALELANDSSEEIALMPWVRNLIQRGLKELPEEAHMTEYGAYLRGNPIPGKPQASKALDWHFIPAANWSTRVVLPIEDGSNTLAMVLRPEDMLKIYNWHRPLEDFCTQEVIAAPLLVKPGEKKAWEYYLVVAPPVRNIVYGSPELFIGCTPHPTGIAADTKELTLSFAATGSLDRFSAEATLVSVADPTKELSTTKLELDLAKSLVVETKVPVQLRDATNYQLRLRFKHDGQRWHPGQAVGDHEDVIIPLVVGSTNTAERVFPLRTKGVARLPRVEPRTVPLPRIASTATFDAFSHPASERCFKHDTITAASDAPLRLYAGRGEFESCQLLLVPKQADKQEFYVTATELSGPDGSRVACESVNEFVYVPTQIPSGYNARKLVGEYPEALVPTEHVTLSGEKNHPLFVTYHVPHEAKPGVYRGVVCLTSGETRHEIPVELTVWNFEIPRRTHYMEPATSLKNGNLKALRVKAADGHVMSVPELQKAIVDMHLTYRLTPCDSGIVRNLITLNFPAFEAEMNEFVARGATKIYLGSVPQMMAQPANVPKIEAYLKEKGWLDYFYVRAGFDEASPDLIPKIKANCEVWKRVSTIPIMETYYHDEPRELFGLIDIWSRPLGKAPWVTERMAAGDRFWRVNMFPNDLEAPPWRVRKMYLNLWDHGYTGTYIWTVKYWDGITKWGEDYWSDAGVANLGAVLMWPDERGLLSTIRLEALRDAIEDNATFWMLRDKVKSLAGKSLSDSVQAAALEKARAICASPSISDTIRSAADLERVRVEAGNALSILNEVR